MTIKETTLITVKNILRQPLLLSTMLNVCIKKYDLILELNVLFCLFSLNLDYKHFFS